MMVSDDSIIEYLFKGFCAVCGTVGIYFWRDINGDVKTIKDDVEEVKQEHNKYQIYVEREFEKRETIQYSLSRIHERLDKLVDMVSGGKH